MTAKLNQRVLWMMALFVSACATDEEPDGPLDFIDSSVGQTNNPATPGVGAFNDAGAVDAALVPSDASSLPPIAIDAGAQTHDAAQPALDGGPRDAALGDASLGDAGAKPDASADAGGASCDGLSYESFGKQFMTSYCLSCHAGIFAQRSIQLDTLAGIQKNKVAVKREAVTSNAMPTQNPRPTSAERQQLGRWLDCGPN